MYNIDLNAIQETDVYGKWEVQERVVNNSSQSNLFVDVRVIEIEPNLYRSINGKERKGNWTVIREKEVIYNPQLKFFIDGEEVGNAIITRLRYDPIANGNLYKLTLYFSTGLELVLHRLSVKTKESN